MATILLIEPDQVPRMLLAEALEDRGHCVRAVPRAEYAVAGLREEPPDAVVIRLGAWSDNGLGALERGLESWPATPVIAYGLPPRRTWPALGRLGASVIGGAEPDRLERAIRRAVRTSEHGFGLASQAGVGEGLVDLTAMTV